MPDVDYDVLAQQHGGVAANPGVDYDALATQHGGVSGDIESHKITPGQHQPSEFEQEHPTLAKVVKTLGIGLPVPAAMDLPGSGAMLAPQAARTVMNAFPKSKLLLKAYDAAKSLLPKAAEAEAPPIAPEDYYRGQSVPAAEVPPTNPAPSAPTVSAQPASAAAPAKVTPIRPEPAPEPEALRSVTNQPEVPTQTPADIAKSKFAEAKADRFVQAIQQYNRDFPDRPPITSKGIWTLGDQEKSILTQALKSGGYLKNTEKFTNTSFPYIVDKLRAAEAATSATIKPPAGFSLGAMKNYFQ